MAKLIVVVGVGALGSHFVLFARNLDARIKVIDFDSIEQKNVLAQFHTKMGGSKNKALALQAAMQGLFGVKIDAVPHRLEANNADVLLGKADLIVDCLDNGASRRVVQNFARAKGIPCLHGALAPQGLFGRAVWSSIFVVDDEAPGAVTCEDGDHLPFIVTTAAYLAQAAQRFLRTGEQRSFDIFPGGVTRL